MMIGAILSFTLYLIILYVPNIPFMVMYSLFFAAGFAYTAKALSFACICEIMPKSSSAVSVGFINTVVMATGIIFHPLIGKLLVLDWDGSTENGIDIYSLGDYQIALSIVPLCLLFSIIILKFVKETHHKTRLSEGKRGIVYLSDLE